MDTETLEGAIAGLAEQAKTLPNRRSGEARRAYVEGETIPGTGYTLVRYLHSGTGHRNGRGLVRCNSCGMERVGFYAQMAAAGVSGCVACLSKRTRKPRLCRTCDTTDEAKFNPKCATECIRCQRRALRNGRDAEGRAVFRRAHDPVTKANRKRERWIESLAKAPTLWPVGDTSGKPHPCGAPVPRHKTARCLVVTTKPNCSVACRNRRAGRRSDQRGR